MIDDYIHIDLAATFCDAASRERQLMRVLHDSPLAHQVWRVAADQGLAGEERLKVVVAFLWNELDRRNQEDRRRAMETNRRAIIPMLPKDYTGTIHYPCEKP